jgi:hypothetical protein
VHLQFFLFNDILVYASMKAFSSKFTLHQSLPLDSLSVRVLLLDLMDSVSGVSSLLKLN